MTTPGTARERLEADLPGLDRLGCEVVRPDTGPNRWRYLNQTAADIRSILDDNTRLREGLEKIEAKTKECADFDAANLDALRDEPKVADAFSFSTRMYWSSRAALSARLHEWVSHEARQALEPEKLAPVAESGSALPGGHHD